MHSTNRENYSYCPWTMARLWHDDWSLCCRFRPLMSIDPLLIHYEMWKLLSRFILHVIPNFVKNLVWRICYLCLAISTVIKVYEFLVLIIIQNELCCNLLTFLSCSVIKVTNDDDFKAVSIGNCVEDFNIGSFHQLPCWQSSRSVWCPLYDEL